MLWTVMNLKEHSHSLSGMQEAGEGLLGASSQAHKLG
jgi:hypothetical protein